MTMAALCAASLLSGCFSVNTAISPQSGEEHVVVRNYGWVLFNCIPLVCGNSAKDASSPWAFFRNDVTMDKIQAHFMDYAVRCGKRPEDLKYTDYDSVLFDIPFVQFPLPIPYIICYREIQLSGNLR